MSKETAEVLSKAKALIGTPEKFTSGAYARDAEGVACHYDSPLATCRCSVGAILAAAPGADTWRVLRSAERALMAVAPVGPGISILTYSDSLTHDQAMAWWASAITAEEAAS